LDMDINVRIARRIAHAVERIWSCRGLVPVSFEQCLL
jgi:hypothetical protein